MSSAELAATGLQTYDVTVDAATYDHLPLVVDFRFPIDGAPGDFTLDRAIDLSDRAMWQETFGSPANHDADGSGNSIVDAADYVVWRKFTEPLGGGGLSLDSYDAAPEPAPYLLILSAFTCLCIKFCGRTVARQSINIRNRSDTWTRTN
jgi:hypothetical protein